MDVFSALTSKLLCFKTSLSCPECVGGNSIAPFCSELRAGRCEISLSSSSASKFVENSDWERSVRSVAPPTEVDPLLSCPWPCIEVSFFRSVDPDACIEVPSLATGPARPQTPPNSLVLICTLVLADSSTSIALENHSKNIDAIMARPDSSKSSLLYFWTSTDERTARFVSIFYPAFATAGAGKDFRLQMHRLLGLPVSRPVLRPEMALFQDSQSVLLQNVHRKVAAPTSPGESLVVRGRYSFCHYGQGINDAVRVRRGIQRPFVSKRCESFAP